MTDTVRFDLLARDQASKPVLDVGRAFEKTERSAGLLSKTFGAVSAGSRGLHTSFGILGRGALLAAGAAGVGGLAAAFKGVYTEAREAQKVSAQTNAVIRSTGGVAKVSAGHVGALATSISNKVGVDDEAIQSGANLILTFTRVRNEVGKGNNIFDRATSTITDMAAAMNHGEVTSDGLKTASIQVGKALQDPIKGVTALTKVGVTFTQKQKDQIKSLVEHGHALDAQKIILGELNTEFGGSAAAGTTAMQKLGVVFGNIKESVGTALLPTIDSVANWLSERLPGALRTAGRVAGPIFHTLGLGFGGFAAALSGEGVTSDGFVGVMEQIGDAGHRLNDFIHKTIIPGLAGLVSAFNGEGVTSDGFVGVMENIGVIGKKTVDYIKGTLVPDIVAAFGSVKTDIGNALSGVDLSGIAATFTAQARKWGGALIDGVKVGLATGDWSGLGETVGRGIIAAISGAASLAKQIAAKISELFSKVDWVGIGITVGKQMPSLLIGLAAGILNFDLMGLLKGLAQHWQDVLLAIIAVAFTPARIIGKVAEVLGRVPLAGPLLRWAFEHFAAFSKGLVKMVGDALGFMGRAFLDGFQRVFPGVGTNFLAHLRNLPTYVQVVALEVVGRARQLMRGLADAIAGGIARVIANIGELIAKMLRPFVGAGGWLVRHGIEFVSGLVRGIGSQIGSAAASAGRVVSTVTRPFLGAGRWLLGAGGDLIRGLLSGARGALSAVGQWAKDIGGRIVGAVKGFFGIHSPSTVFAGIGGHLMSGLIKGMLEHSPAALVGKVFGGMPQALRQLFSKGLISAAAGLPEKALTALGSAVTGLFSDPKGHFVNTLGGRNVGIVQSMAQQLFGWVGDQWNALRSLVQGESGFSNTAQNPTSSAFGLGQFLSGTWATVGLKKTSDPTIQSLGLLRYIKQIYGTPANAYSKWLSRKPHWYAAGMDPTVFSRPTLIGVGERGSETVSVTPGRGGAGRPINVTVNNAPDKPTTRALYDVLDRMAIMHRI